MRKPVILIAFLCTIFPAFSQIEFQKAYGDAGSEVQTCYTVGIESLKQTPEGGYVIVGSGQYPLSGGPKWMYVIKTDAYGDTIWASRIGENSSTTLMGTSVIIDNQGNYVSIGWDEAQMIMVKLNPGGSVIWSKAFASSTTGCELKQTSDGGYIALGSSLYDYGSIEGINLLKTDINGNLLWMKGLIPYTTIGPLDIIQTKDKGFVVTGGSNGLRPGFAVKTDSVGNVQWTNCYGQDSISTGELISVIELPTGDLVFTGDMSSKRGVSPYWQWLLKTDKSGNPIWCRKYADTSEVYNHGVSIVQTPDKGFAIAGNGSYGSLLKTDSTGKLTWIKYFYKEGFDAIVCTNDNGYALSGFTTYGIGAGNICLVKTDSNGNSGCNTYLFPTVVDTVNILTASLHLSDTSVNYPASCSVFIQKGLKITTICSSIETSVKEEKMEGSISVYPNPSTGEFTFDLNDLNLANQELDIYNMLGEKIYTSKINTVSAQVDLSSQPPGVYLYRVVSGNAKDVYSGKLIIR
ncbi:MAG TPA: T9SS type A sorting domain-containing protein [Bacteroidia bacterium]|jgi:hypothetical protein|nr:T9SS type A sorting domain-containing protein [Bacteroidia bacterium]